MKRLTRAAARREWARAAREVNDPATDISSGIEYAEELADGVEALLADRAELTRQLRDVRAKNRDLRRGPRIIGEPEVYVVPHDGEAAYVFADFDAALRYAQVRGQGWEPDDAEVLDRKSAAAVIAEETRRQSE